MKESALDKYNKLTEKYAMSAYEYFMILRLAIYHLDGLRVEYSVDIVDYLKEHDYDSIYKLGCEIVKALNKKGK